jgi:hypothetical protein
MAVECSAKLRYATAADATSANNDRCTRASLNT